MSNELIKKSIAEDYKYGFETDVEQDTFSPGLDENVIQKLSNIKNEPEWLLEWRLKAYRHWLKMTEPNWANVKFNPIDYQSISYYSAPKKKSAGSLDEIDPEILETYTKLGIPLDEQKMMEGVAVDAVFDSVSVATTFKDSLKKAGVIFCPFSEAVQEHPELVKKYLGSVVPATDNYYAALNSAVFSDGSFVYIPKGAHKNTSILMVIPGASRDTQRFHASWLSLAKEDTFVVVTVGASKKYFPDEYSYNAGNVIDEGGNLLGADKWLFNVIEKIFKKVKENHGFQTEKFYLFGHSAGGGFVHRYMLFMTDAPVVKAVAANPAFVTLPDNAVGYPFGLKNIPINNKKVKWIKKIKEINCGPVIFLGNEFFDALPIKQIYKKKKLFFEKYVTLSNDNKKIRFLHKKANNSLIKRIQDLNLISIGNTIEYPIVALKFLGVIAEKINKFDGGLLTLDYGNTTKKNQNTLQSIKKHRYTNIFVTSINKMVLCQSDQTI